MSPSSSTDSTKRIAIPKFGFHSRVRVCDACYEVVATELESSEVVLKLLELTGEKPDAPPEQQAYKPAIAAHAQAMEALKHRAAVEKANAAGGNLKGGAGGAPENKRGSVVTGNANDDKKRFTLPTVNKPHLFALKNSERELWLHAENTETRLEWVQAIRGIQKRKNHQMSSSSSLPSDDSPPKPSAPSWEIEYPQISVLNKVGVGAFGEVFRARLWGTEVAMKTLKTEQFKDAEALLEDLKKEVSILSQLRHPNVVLYIGACTNPPNVCILTEWCSRGSLYDLLHDYSIHLPAKLCMELAMGIAQGMNYLHSLPSRIIHRDLKSHNILVNKSYAVKVADFGLSHVRELQVKGASASDPIVHKGPKHYGMSVESVMAER
jgi:tRNA A-37 threonylcarbamoyl transferase component Bud32